MTRFDDSRLAQLRCPRSGQPLRVDGDALESEDGKHRYPVHDSGIPLFAEQPETRDAARQQEHYDRIAEAYVENLGYPHTVEYDRYLHRVILEELGDVALGVTAELCCGDGEALALVGNRASRAFGVDISVAMLETAATRPGVGDVTWLQADATRLPLADASLDTVLMFGGVHHVADRQGLFREVARVLRPGGRFLWREPVSDWWPWRALRAVIYRLSPTLDHETERPLRLSETEPPLIEAGLELTSWRTCGFLGFCFLMNSDVLVLNRLLRFLPGITALTRAAARFDERCVQGLGPRRFGLQVVGSARKPA